VGWALRCRGRLARGRATGVNQRARRRDRGLFRVCPLLGERLVCG
jgi:hypothetical protein